MKHWNNEEAVARIGDTSEGVIPSEESSEDTEDATGLDATKVGRARAVKIEVADTEQEECHVKSEEEQGECYCRAQCAQEQEEREDEPALNVVRHAWA